MQVEFDAKTLTSAGDAANEQQSITVFGEVHRPGSFAHKREFSVIDMLMRAGGVTRYAGIEQIRVISKGKPSPFNMREYLDTGDSGLMPALAPGDVIFVPQATEQIKTGARTVYVMGEVFQPGAYETKENAKFLDILANAGGPTRFAETRQIRVLKPDGQTIPVDLQAYTEGSGIALPPVLPGDAIFIPEKTDMNEKSWLKIPTHRAVRVIGAWLRPGRYEWSAEMGLLDLIAHAGGPNASADTAHLQIIPPDSESGPAQPAIFNLKRYLEKADIPLPPVMAGATVVLPELPKDPNDNRSQWVRQSSASSIYIMGQVGAPGRYAFNADLNFLDILAAAQGPTARADLANIRISHRNGDIQEVSRINLHLYFESGDENLLPPVLPEDVIFVPDTARDWLQRSKESTIRVLGAVARPGRYTFSDDMTLLDLLAEAGGPLPDALQDRIVVINKGQKQDQARVFDLEAFAQSADFTSLPVLRSGDTVYIPGAEQSNWNTFSKILRDSLSVVALVSFL
ncbi:SLBB domain-containing protein [Pseudobowmanella zhangzhouensis]